MAAKIYGGNNQLIECINNITDKWMILWNELKEEEGTSYLAEIFTHKPSINEIRDTIFNWYNKLTEQKILSEFIWNDIPVWLSIENQFNYKMSYDLAMQTNGKNLPVTFKLGTDEQPIYKSFSMLEELLDFYIKMTEHILNTLSKGWELKNNVDFSAYEI